MTSRIKYGKIIVIAEKPQNLLPAVRKQWFKEMRKQQCMRAASLDALTIERTTKLISLMQQTFFTTKAPLIAEYATVFFTTPAKLDVYSMFGLSVFVTCEVDKAKLFDVARFMPDDGLVVEYKKA